MNQELSANATLSHYRIIRKLGAGGMGEVYLAEDSRLHRKIALKILPADLSTNQSRMRRFEQEATAAAALNHPNIAHIYEIGEHDGTHFIAMEFIDGQTLRELINDPQTDLTKLLRHLQHAAEGLAKAHATGIVHRDLKPDNIMVTREGNAKVLDFGLAKLIEQQSPASGEAASELTTVLLQQSTPGMVLGTVGYMSPEQAQGRTKEIDHRSDIFSFGCILFEAVTRRKAFAGKDAIDSLNQIIREPVPPIADFNPSAPTDLQRIVQRCLAKDPDERYQVIKDVAIELKEVRREARHMVSRAVEASASAALSTQQQAGTAASESLAPSVSTLGFVGSIKQHKLATAALIVLVVGAIGLSVYLVGRNNGAAIDSIAVLPFENQNHDPDSDYLSDGVTESIINSLTQLPSLKVIARSSVFRYKGKAIDPLVAGKELGVRAILTGRIMQRGDDLTISTELVDIRDNKQLWGAQYNRKVADLLAVQREIAAEISRNLQLRLSGEDASRLSKQYTTNSEAYQLYLKGRFLVNKRTAEDTSKGIDYLQQVITKDPNNALAYAGLADAYSHLVFPLGAVAPDEAMPKAREAATKAIAIDNSLGEGHASLAYVIFYYEWDWQRAEQEFKRAIELNPNNADAHHWYSHYLMSQRRIDDSLVESKRALELNPLDMTINIHLAWHYHYARQYDLALEQMNRTIELDRNFAQAYPWLGLILEQKGNYGEAIAAFQKAIALFPGGSTAAKAELGHALAASGNKTEALRIIKELGDSSPRAYVAPYLIAAIYAALGDKDQMFTWLEKAYQERSDWLVNITADQRFDQFRTDPRFIDLVRRMKLPQ